MRQHDAPAKARPERKAAPARPPQGAAKPSPATDGTMAAALSAALARKR
jgi:hypothetical protein